jgi:hypothetical protein
MTRPGIYYVYALMREDGQTPFYIGKGCGKRIDVHESQAMRDNSHKGRILQKIIKQGLPVTKIKLVEGLLDEQAKQIECDLIQLIGRWPIGPLANLTRGGDGVANLSEASRAQKSLRNVLSWQDPKVREARALGIKKAKMKAGIVWRYPKPPKPPGPSKEETRQKRSASMKARWAVPEQREKGREASRKFQASPEYRQRRSKIAKTIWSNPEWKEKVLADRNATRKPVTPEQAQLGAARLNSPEAREKRRITNAIPEINAKRVAAQKSAFSTPEAKARRSEVSKKMWAAKKAQNTLPSASVKPSQPL